MENLVDKALKEMISNALLELEDIANSDVLCYSGYLEITWKTYLHRRIGKFKVKNRRL